MRVSFEVNGRIEVLETESARRLVDILREEFGLVGAKLGCGVGRCGTCMVLIDGKPCNACLVSAFQLEGRSVRTIEGLLDGPENDRARRILAEEGAVQCGYCMPGLVVTLSWLLATAPNLSADEAEAQLTGHLCRCTGYGGIRRAMTRLFPERSAPAPR